MDSQRIMTWIQVLTSVLVLVGLVLVVWELQQARSIAHAQLISDNFGHATQIHTSLFGENASDVIAKSCSKPEELSEGEIQILMRVHLAHLNLALRNYEIDVRTGVTANSWRNEARRNLSAMFSCAPGRAMWKIFGPALPPEFQRLGQEIIDTDQPNESISDLVEQALNEQNESAQ